MPMSAVVFRLGREWLALPTHLFREVMEVRPIHSLPHRSNDVLLGIVNVEGEIHLCASIGDLLGLQEDAAGREAGHGVYRRMAVVEREGERWVFVVNEIQTLPRRPNSRCPRPRLQQRRLPNAWSGFRRITWIA